MHIKSPFQSIYSKILYVLFSLLLWLSGIQIGFGQSLRLQTQQDVNGVNLSLTRVAGDLIIRQSTSPSSDPIVDLSPLSNIEYISGSLVIAFHESLSDLDGLNNIDSLGGSLLIFENTQLEQINDINGITVISGSLEVRDNTLLQSLAGLNNVIKIREDIHLERQDALQDLSFLNAINADLKSLSIRECKNLTQLGSISGNVTENLIIEQCNRLKTLEGVTLSDTLLGDVIIGSNDSLIDVKALIGVTDIKGSVRIIDNLNLDHLNEFDALHSVSGDLDLLSNHALININGLQGLHYIGGSLRLLNCPLIDALPDFNELDSIGQSLVISEIDSLNSLAGLHAIKKIGRNISFSHLPRIRNFSGMQSLKSVEETIALVDLQHLTDVSGWLALEEVGIKIEIFDCNALQQVDQLETLRRLGGLAMGRNTQLQSLSGLKNIEGDFDFELALSDMPALENLAGLEHITGVGRSLILEGLPLIDSLQELKNITGNVADLIIKNNNNLRSLAGLENIKAVNNDLHVIDNNFLNDLNGLSNVRNVGGSMIVRGNDRLDDCCGVYYLISTPDAVQDFVVFNNQGFASCKVVDDVIAQCDSITSQNEVVLNDSDINVYPNPTRGMMYIGSLDGVDIQRVQFQTMAGEIVYDRKEVNVQRVNAMELSEGLYVLRVIDSLGRKYFRKVMIVD